MPGSKRSEELGPPSERSAVIVRARLPAALERVRRDEAWRSQPGLPAHATLLYPFVAPERLDAAVRRDLAAVAARHGPFPYRLTGPQRWPGVVYAAVDPPEPFVALQASLGAAFPDFPIYGPDARFTYVPHVTIVEGGAGDGARLASATRGRLSLSARATHLEVIVRVAGLGWRTLWRIPLGRPATGGRR